MDKITYLAELAEGLARWVPERERQEILRYYAEYFEEAGYQREAEVMAELGDPWALSCRLAVEGGYVTREQAMSWRPGKKRRRVLIGAAVGLTVFALVSGIGLMAFNFVRYNPMRGTAVAVASEPEMFVAYGYGQATEGDSIAVVEAIEGALIDGGSVEAFDSIDADISLGNIQVVAGDDYTVSVRRNKAMSGYELSWEVRNGALRLRDGGRTQQVQVNGWDDLKNLFGVGRQAVEVTVTVPEGAALDKVSVKTGLGDVLLYGMTTETVTAETGLGDVECYNVWHARTLELSTGMGDVNLGMEEALGGLYIGLETGMGNVEASLCGAEKDYYYELESGMGAVTVNGDYRGSEAERKDSAPYRICAESGMGDVNVHFTFD